MNEIERTVINAIIFELGITKDGDSIPNPYYDRIMEWDDGIRGLSMMDVLMEDIQKK